MRSLWCGAGGVRVQLCCVALVSRQDCVWRAKRATKNPTESAFGPKCMCRKQDACEKRRALLIAPEICTHQNCQNACKIDIKKRSKRLQDASELALRGVFQRSNRKPRFLKDVLHAMTGFSNAQIVPKHATPPKNEPQTQSRRP